MSTLKPLPSMPAAIAGIGVPQDEISLATWRWARRTLPNYLFAHSVRAYCWGAAIAAAERWTFDLQILWTASLVHDVGLTRLPRNTMCFEVEGAEIARRFLEREGMPAELADRVAIAIILHMQPSVTLDDGVEAVLLDRATGLDVRGDGYEQVDAVRPGVVREFPRRDFDRRFLDAITREAAIRRTCQSARLLHRTGLAEWIARSPWATGTERDGRAG
jgi:HD superfamily phosphodiesterase